MINAIDATKFFFDVAGCKNVAVKIGFTYEVSLQACFFFLNFCQQLHLLLTKEKLITNYIERLLSVFASCPRKAYDGESFKVTFPIRSDVAPTTLLDKKRALGGAGIV